MLLGYVSDLSIDVPWQDIREFLKQVCKNFINTTILKSLGSLLILRYIQQLHYSTKRAPYYQHLSSRILAHIIPIGLILNPLPA